MKFLQLLACSLLPISGLAAKASKDASQRFGTYLKKSQSAIPMKLDDKSMADLTSTPRDYSTIVLLTALEARFGCQICKEFQPEWDVLAKSWLRGDRKGESRLLFGTLDFVDGKNTFQKFMLQTAPVLFFFPPTSGPNAKNDGQPVRYDFTTGSSSAEMVRDWVARQLQEGAKAPEIYRPFNWMKLIITVTIVLGLLTVAFVASPYVLPVIQNRNLWAAISLIIILLFTSGHMFNHIRGVPYISGNGKGGITYFAGGFQNQFGMETQIIAAMYGILSFATIALALKVPRMSDPKSQQFAVIAWALIMFVMYSFLLSVFKIKNGSYPFSLPPF
ncbi:oligosaccharyl transferase subunit ost3/OST6 [Agyrium rufum]|nr:oligosaccharyl transferase subunit ost3/OST6 [Agyrium rufum]